MLRARVSDESWCSRALEFVPGRGFVRRRPPRRTIRQSSPGVLFPGRASMDARARASRTSLGRGAPRRVRRRRPRGNVDDGTCVRDRCSRATRSRARHSLGVALGVHATRVGALGVASGGAFLPDVYAYVQPTAPWMKVVSTSSPGDESRRFSPATRRRPPLVDARGTRRESRDAIKNIIIARARRSSFVDVIARARSPAPARVVDRARFRSSSGRRLRRLSCCARSVVVVVQPISRDS